MPQPVAEKDGGDLHYDHRGNRVEVQGADFDLTIQNGRVVSWVIDGSQRLVAPLEPAYFRALTDNDIDFLNFVPPLIKFHPLVRLAPCPAPHPRAAYRGAGRGRQYGGGAHCHVHATLAGGLDHI